MLSMTFVGYISFEIWTSPIKTIKDVTLTSHLIPKDLFKDVCYFTLMSLYKRAEIHRSKSTEKYEEKCK